jgi:transposase
MSNKTVAISDSVFFNAEISLKSLGKSGEIGRKLQAIISAKNHGISSVSKIFGISRQTLMNWISRFSENLDEGLTTKIGRGRKQLINNNIKQYIYDTLQSQPNTTLLQIKQLIEINHNVNASVSTIHRLVKSLELSYITPRPKHYKADINQQNEFKKNFKKE